MAQEYEGNVYQAFEQQPTDAPIQGEDFAKSAFGRIDQQSGSGSFGEGQIRQVVSEFKNLEDMVRGGQISQADFISAGNKIRDYTKPIMERIMYGGNRAASAGTNAGAYELAHKYYRNLDIYGSAQEVLGRDLSPTEFAALAPTFGSGSAKELEAGRGYLAQLAEQEKNSPAALEKRYKQNAGQYGGQVGGLFQEMLGRAASQEENDHFGKMLASGEVDPYELRQFMSQLPEYRQREDTAASAKRTQEDTAARGQLASELGQYDQDFFGKAKEDVISRYSRAGIQNSPSLDFALTNLMGDIQKERSAYLADVARQDYKSNQGYGREDYLANKGLLREDYMTNLNRQFGSQDYGRDRSAQLEDMLRGRSYEISDYTTQRNDLMDLLSRQNQGGGSKKNFGGALSGAIGGGGALSSLGPWGAAGGAAAGLFSYLGQ